VSSKTGETVADFINDKFPNDFPQYGWTDVDFTDVGAPMCSDWPNPDPGSSDPLYPGILVHKGADGAFLTIGNIGNLVRLEKYAFGKDGCGIYLTWFEIADQRVYGSWGAYGIRVDGEGYFCARRLTVPSN
jgi:hypothetical protein